jgi:hypothetical protein
VEESKSSVPARWSITLIPAEPKASSGALRPAPRVSMYAEDRH